MLSPRRLKAAAVAMVSVLIPLLGSQVAFAATPVPTLTSPASGAIVGSSISVSFNLPAIPASNSVTLTFVGTSTYTLILNTSSIGSTSFTLNDTNLSSNAQVTSVAPLVSSIPDGTYTVVLSYQDQALDPPATASSSNVTIDTAPPAATSVSPTNGQTAVAIGVVPTIVLNKAVTKGSGSIVIRKVADNSVFESIAVGSGQVTLGSQITITPSAQFDYGTTYSVSIPTGAFVGFFNSVPNAAYSWQFTTAQNPVPPAVTSQKLTDTGTKLSYIEWMACGLITLTLIVYILPSSRRHADEG